MATSYPGGFDSFTEPASGVALNTGGGANPRNHLVEHTDMGDAIEALEHNAAQAKSGGYTAGRVPFATGALTTSDEANLAWDSTNHRLQVGSVSPVAKGHFTSGGTGEIGLIVQAFAAQTANQQEWRDSTGSTALASISAGGAVTASALAVGSVFAVDSSGRMGITTGVNTSMLAQFGASTHPGSAANLYGVVVQPQYPSTTTSSASNFYSYIYTAASAFTVTAAHHYRADGPSTIGAGSAITTVNAFSAANQGVAGITNAYGVNISAQSGAATLNVSGRFDTGSTCALWLGGNATATDVTGGIAFGSARDVTAFRSSATTFMSNAALATRRTAAPADGDLSANDMAIWFDPTNGASKLMVKAKQADGTVKTASIALA